MIRAAEPDDTKREHPYVEAACNHMTWEDKVNLPGSHLDFQYIH